MLRVEKFDMKKRVLTMHFSNKNDPDLAASFSLSADKTKAILSIGGKEIRANSIGTFDAAAKFRGPPTRNFFGSVSLGE